MKSGLKGKSCERGGLRHQVATYAAMKSGLKALERLCMLGIEKVATYAAMKSGLKVRTSRNPGNPT